jgi:hypothetical protein
VTFLIGYKKTSEQCSDTCDISHLFHALHLTFHCREFKDSIKGNWLRTLSLPSGSDVNLNLTGVSMIQVPSWFS